MASIHSPLNTAHQHAANADDYVAQGLLVPAAEEHYKAAEAYQACVEAATDENTKRTLRMLCNDHSKAGKELQRRIAKLREENKDPNLPQKPTSGGPSSSNATRPVMLPSAPSPPPQAQNRLSDSQQMVDESFMLLGQRCSALSAERACALKLSGLPLLSKQADFGEASQVRQRAGHMLPISSDSGDPFNQFWKITEGMLDYLSQPVAFATAPLAPPSPAEGSRRRDGSSSSDTDLEEAISKRISRGIGLVKAARSRMLTRHDSSATTSDSESGRAGPSTFPPKPVQDAVREDWDDEFRADDVVSAEDDMADSFCLIPSKSDPGASTLKKENDSLRVDVEELRKRLASAEGMLKMRQEQDQQLRDSILLARKEAHRAMISSTVGPVQRSAQPGIDLASLNINVPPVPPPVAALNPGNLGRDREAQLVRRVRELEEEARTLRVENEKQKAMIVRFRERWEKLKESAKRKKEAKAAAEATNIVHERIEEDPEAEAEAEKDSS
ncbi:hypothetical protein DAEQUDRAFT_738400 [Daedalea quercina L-15889]|uniref:MIT domain-containing protein n=1 Tax=Daedalea quercina L-15889 TaxID=1314783 RepID=A0A165Q6Q5_9APHY|nr:hypothetical protein DAEQUDRAFT_738400 [Daedalea quercina L-15889]